MFSILLSLVASILSHFTNVYADVAAIVGTYGYFAIFGLMALEYASLPIPSEIVLPLIGFFAADGIFSFPIALAVVLVAGVVGMFADYYLAYFVGREFMYKYAHKFGIRKHRLHEFEDWFQKHGHFAVFIARLIPILRGLVSFPAGFARMDKKVFIAYSFVGALIWDVVLMSFGYYGLASNDANIVMASVGIFGLVVYLLYRYSMAKIEKM